MTIAVSVTNVLSGHSEPAGRRVCRGKQGVSASLAIAEDAGLTCNTNGYFR
jgi:hypothetical protein